MSHLDNHHARSSSAFLILLFVAGLAVGGIIISYFTLQQINDMKRDISSLRSQISELSGTQNITYENITLYQDGTSLSEMYEKVKDSIVLILGNTAGGDTVQGSGFVYNSSGTIVVITNYHVVHGTTSTSVTFSNGNGYAATVNGTDPYADLAVLIVSAPESEFRPIEVVSSLTLRVGDPVIAIGNPYGLVGSLTTGVVSALKRTITEEEYAGGFAIPNMIQTSAPINPGNSGGPLLNYNGNVVGITTAIVQDSQGLGFAIPTSTLIKEINSLMSYGTYEGHSYLGIRGTDMTYYQAQTMDVNVTYGWIVSEVVSNGPSSDKLNANDIIIAMNGTQIRNGDELASYLEENTIPQGTLNLKVMRETDSTWQETDVTVVLGQRPAPPV